LAGLGVGLVIALALLGYKYIQRDDYGEELRVQVMESLEGLPDYETHASLYNSWFDAHHEHLIQKHYHIGGRRSRSWFDGAAYLGELFTAMATDAAADGYNLQAESLRVLGTEMYFDEE
jgi:hypothetical protein